MRAARLTGIVALAAGLAAAGLLVGWILLSDPTAGEPVLPGEVAGRTAAATDLPLLAGRGAGEEAIAVAVVHATVDGWVRRGGQPSAATVEIRQVGRPGDREREREVTVAIAAREGTPTAIATAGEDGRFRASGLLPGVYEARAIAADGLEGFAAFDVREGDFASVTVELPAGSESVGGRAVHADGRPFGGWVLAIPYQEHDDDDHADLTGGAVAPVDPDGRFLVRGLRPGPYIFSLLVPGRMRNVLSVIQAPAAREILLVADAGCAEVSGRVVGAEDGRPVPFARVVAQSTEVPGWFVHALTTADGEGRFRVLASSRGFALVVDAPGYAPLRRSFARVSGEVVVRLPRPARVQGRVVAEGDGRPVEGAVVWLAVADVGTQRTVSAPDGRFAFPEAPVTDEAEVYVLGGGWASRGIEALYEEGLNPFFLDLGPGASVSLDLVAGPAARIEGRVLSADGGSVPAEVRCAIEGEAPYAATRADVEGRFVLSDLPPGVEVHLAARHPQHAPAEKDVRLSGTGPTPVEIRLPPARWLHVSVDAAGKPVAGARVTWYLLDPDSDDGDDEGEAQRDVHLTDAAGKVRIGPLPEGRIHVSVTRRGYVATPALPATGPAGGDLRAEVSLAEGLVVEGLVLAPDGISPEGAVVGIGAGAGWWNVQVGPDGAFRFDGVPADDAWVSASLSARGRDLSAELELDLEGKGDVRDVRLSLESDPDDERGWEVRVLDPSGRPVAAGSLALYRGEEDGSYQHVARSRIVDGLARFAYDEEWWGRPLWAIPTRVLDEFERVVDGAPTPAGPFIPKDGPAEVRMEPGRRISGRVLRPDGRPAVGAWVKARIAATPRGTRGPASDAEHAARVDPEGRFVLPGLADAEHWVWLETPEGYAPDPAQSIAAGSEGVTLRLRAALRVAVTVLDPGGAPVRGASVFWRRKDVPEDTEEGHDATTDRAGVARFAQYDPDARYTVTVNPPDSREELGWLDDFPARPEDVTVTLPRALAIRGVVRRTDDQPPGAVLIWTRGPGESGWSAQAWSSDDDTFVLPRMGPGRYLLCATPGRAPGEGAPGVPVEAGDGNVVLPLYVPPKKEAEGAADARDDGD